MDNLTAADLLGLRDALNAIDLDLVASLAPLPAALVPMVAEWHQLPYAVTRRWVMERGWRRWMELAPEARAALVWHLARLDRTDAHAIERTADALRADLRIPRWALATAIVGLADMAERAG